MEEIKLIETVNLIFDFQYTIPGSKKSAVYLSAGEKFRLLERKSKNWYLVSRLETDESFFVPVSYTEVVKLPLKKPTVVPPSLPAKPKNLFEKLKNDLEINPPSAPVIGDSAKIELFKLLSAVKPKHNLINPYDFQNCLHKSDSHVDKIPHNNESVVFKGFKQKEDNFNSLPKVSKQDTNFCDTTSSKSLSLHVPTTSPLAIQTPPKSFTLPRNENIPLPQNSPKLSKSKPFTKSLKHLKSPNLKNPLSPSSRATTPRLHQSEKGLSPYTPTSTNPVFFPINYQIYHDQATGQNYYYNPLTNESTWVLPDDKMEKGEGKEENKLELSVSSSDSLATDSMEMLKISSDDDRPNLSKSQLCKSGPLNRTKLTEGGRKLKKYWYCTFAILEDNQLSFFKDKKSSLHQSRADLSIDLNNSFVLKGGTANKLNLIQVITNTGNEYLLQSNDQSEIQEWFELLTAASSLAAADSVDITNSLSRESLDKNSRMTVSTEELSSNDNNNSGRLTSATDKSRLIERLKMWLSKRPTQDSLREKGIYKEAIFGSSLELICEREDCLVPSFVINCMRTVEERGLQVDGIYRVNGNMADIQKLRMAVDSNGTYDLTDTDIHTVAGALKMFFRELQQPLIPFEHYEDLLAAFC